MWNSIKVQLKIMRVSREFRVALLIASLYAVYAFVFYALEARKEDIFRVLDANEYVCFSPNNGLWNMYLMVYPFLVVMPFATSYISDYKNRLMVIYASRVSRRNYYLSKLVASFIGSALVVAIPFLLNLLLCNIFFPHNLNYWSIYPTRNYYGRLFGLTFAYEHISSQIPFLGVLLSSPVLYGVLYIFLFSFISGLLGMLAMAISFVIKRFKIILYILQGFMPGYRGGQGYVSETAVYAAVLFSIIHFVITSDCLEDKISIKIRVIVCSIPCSVTMGFLAYELGLHNYLRFIKEDLTYVVLWGIFLLLSFILYMTIYWVIEWNYLKQGKEYDIALQAYKDKNKME